MRTMLSRACAALALILLASIGARADDYPSRPVRLIIPFPPGGSNDVVGRMVANGLSEQLGQQVFVDNRGGAGGVIGTETCAKAAPDGYTLCLISIAHAVNPALLQAEIRSDQILRADLDPGDRPERAGGQPELPVKSVKDLIALAKQNPGKLNYASAGIGSFQHLGGELFKLQAGVNIVHVPYKGGGPRCRT